MTPWNSSSMFINSTNTVHAYVKLSANDCMLIELIGKCGLLIMGKKTYDALYYQKYVDTSLLHPYVLVEHTAPYIFCYNNNYNIYNSLGRLSTKFKHDCEDFYSFSYKNGHGCKCPFLGLKILLKLFEHIQISYSSHRVAEVVS